MVASPGEGEHTDADHAHSGPQVWDPYRGFGSQLGLAVWNILGCLENVARYNKIAHMKH